MASASTDQTPSRVRAVLLFLAWAVVGVLFGLGVAALLTVGVLLLAVAAIGTVVLRRVPGAWRYAWGVAFGPAAVALFLAYLNRGGPGTVCTGSAASGQTCIDEYSPWPFVVVAVGCAIVAIGGQLVANRRRRTP